MIFTAQWLRIAPPSQIHQVKSEKICPQAQKRGTMEPGSDS
ncbi:hypothetical protein HMPREF0577_0899 [Mobiluncus mulieris ATCC 35243]|nr:hypothetical protein HMPREF0577_0899 [Mobiluncus mulieris ATCC 35243]